MDRGDGMMCRAGVVPDRWRSIALAAALIVCATPSAWAARSGGGVGDAAFAGGLILVFVFFSALYFLGYAAGERGSTEAVFLGFVLMIVAISVGGVVAGIVGSWALWPSVIAFCVWIARHQIGNALRASDEAKAHKKSTGGAQPEPTGPGRPSAAPPPAEEAPPPAPLIDPSSQKKPDPDRQRPATTQRPRSEPPSIAAADRSMVDLRDMPVLPGDHWRLKGTTLVSLGSGENFELEEPNGYRIERGFYVLLGKHAPGRLHVGTVAPLINRKP